MMLKEKQMSQWSIEWLYGGSTFPLNLLSVNAYQSRYFIFAFKSNSRMMMNSKNSPLISADASDRGYGFTDEIMKELKAEKEEVERIRR